MSRAERRSPWQRRARPYLEVVPPGLYIFVPALMSVGFLFWLAALIRDRFRRQHERSLERRSEIAGAGIAAQLRGEDPPPPDVIGPGRRRFYALTAGAFTGLAAYVLVGTVANYLRPGGYVAEIAWVLAVSLLLAVVFSWFGALFALVAYRWPVLSPPLRRVVARAPIGGDPDDDGLAQPSPRLTMALLVTAGLAALLAMVVGSSRRFLARIDEPLLEAVADAGWIGTISSVDVLGSSLFAIVAAGLLGVASFRCRVLVMAIPVAVTASFVSNNVLKVIVERERPPTGSFADRMDSFPSGHVLLVTILAALTPLSIAVMAHSTRPVRWLRWIAYLAIAGGALHRLHDQAHWPTDVVGSLLIGAAIVLAVEWAMAHEAWHRRCSDCPWRPDVAPEARRGVVPMQLTSARALQVASHVAAGGVAVLLAVLSLTRGVPSNPEGALIDQAIQRPIQLGLAGVVSVGALVSWRWPWLGAVLLAAAAGGLGFMAAIQYEPIYALGMTIVVLVPAVLLWLSWQHRRTRSEIGALAVVSGALVLATWAGASVVYDANFGPTHPESATATAPLDRVEWMWTGGLADDRVGVAVRVDAAAAAVRVVAVGEGHTWTSEVVAPNAAGIARMRLEGLEPDTHYELAVEVDGALDDGRGRGSFATTPGGAATFRFVASSCAQTGSNGSVFDAIRAEEPAFFVHLGDLHYSNIARNEPDRFRSAFDRVLTSPAQAALYREVPVEYVWDDHDYGPNDADASSPARDAARSVFREAVPSHRLESDDGAIHRAFTVGRVRFLVTDTRSERTAATMLGADQLRWFERELVAGSRSHALVVWINPTPWIGAAIPGSDGWGGYPDERRRIADAVADAGIDNLVMISGDAHMVAYDDGTNSDYSSNGTGAAGFPVFHTAALDRPGSAKGGPFSGGVFPGGGQYGVVDIADDGDALTVTLTGKTWDGEILLTEELRFEPGR